jgi:hypothetical protein
MPNCWRPFFLVLPKNCGCQVDLANSWRCSKQAKMTFYLEWREYMSHKHSNCCFWQY